MNQILRRQTSPFHYGSKFSAVTITVFTTIPEQNRKNSCQISAKLSEVNVKNRREKHRLRYFYKMNNGLTPGYLSSLVPNTLRNINDHNTRHSTLIPPVRAWTTLYAHYFFISDSTVLESVVSKSGNPGPGPVPKTWAQIRIFFITSLLRH